MSPATYRRTESVLGLPEYALDLVRDRDIPQLAEAGLADRPLRWLSRQVDGANAAAAEPDLVMERTHHSVTVREATTAKPSSKGSSRKR